MTATNIVQFGSHSARFERPDLLVVQWNGDVSSDEMLAFLDAVEQFSESCPLLYILHDMTNSGVPGPAARKVGAHDHRTKLMRVTAVVRARFHVRVVATMLIKASQFVSKSPMLLEFFDSEQEARKWLEQQREKQMESAGFDVT